MEYHANEVTRGKRFEFGENWRKFLVVVDEERAQQAALSLRRMLSVDDLTGKRFLDVGCGSGLSSLAARQLGATVHSFDDDPQSVAAAGELKRRFFPNDPQWIVEAGSVLDARYVESVGKHDIVYSWGVLHHTGNLWQALACALTPVADEGLAYLAIYNDEEYLSKLWLRIKQTYCSCRAGKLIVTALFVPYFFVRSLLVGLIKYKNPLGHFHQYRSNRGMSIYRDWIDWLGGYPFEVARPEQVFRFCRDAGFELREMSTTNRSGCNEFVFAKRKRRAACQG